MKNVVINVPPRSAPFVDVALDGFGPVSLIVGSALSVSGVTLHALGYDE